MSERKTIRAGIIYAGILVLAAYIFGLFVDLTGDASKYGAIARNILDSGDLINLKIHSEPYDQKPPLLFWLAALGLKIGGIHNWAFKLFPVLYSMAGIWFTYKLGEILYNKNTGKLAAILLATSWIYFLFTADIHTDLVLQANTTLALWQLAAYLKTKKKIHFLGGFIAVGLAMMTKGPVGAVVPAFALVIHLLLTKQYKQLFQLKWLLGIVISLLISFPAFWGLYNQFGLAGFKFFFFTNNIGRITGDYIGSNNDYSFYLHTLAYLLLPWTLLLFYTFWHEIKSYFSPSKPPREYYTAGAIWVYFIIISIAKAKAPHYAFIIAPVIMVVIGHWLNENIQTANKKTLKWLIYLQSVISFGMLAFAILIVGYLFPDSNFVLLLMLMASLTISIYILVKVSEKTIQLLLPSAILMSSFIIVMNAHALPAIASYQASTNAARLFNQKSGPNERIYNYLFPYYEVFFYSNPGADRLYSLKDFKPDEKYSSWIFTNEAGKDTIQQIFPDLIEKTDTFGHRGMSTIRPDFVNPKTREASLQPMYLIRLSSSIKEAAKN